MNNITSLPPLRDSSEAPLSAGNPSDSDAGYVESDGPLIPPQILVPKDEGYAGDEGKVDNKQKRKRTSPKDQATLEAEYKLNPKPNKAARADIVDKVDLNEKEVQIWFQNRRQIQRRKQRPLLPHEIVAFGLGNLGPLSDPASGPVFNSSQNTEENSSSSQEDMNSGQQMEIPKSEGLPGISEPQHAAERVAVANGEVIAESALPPPKPSLQWKPSSEVLDRGTSAILAETVVKSFSSTPGYLANRFNAASSSFSTPAPTQVAKLVTPTISTPIHPASCPERIGVSNVSPPFSQIRLSMSLDGKAELISSESSPPQIHVSRPSSASGLSFPQGRMRTFQRSQSAITFDSMSSTSAGNLIPLRLPRGRSRDARSWQFACDAEARDDLTTQAENEASGSAVAAISLLRSTSRSALKANSNKRHATAASHETIALGKRPKIGKLERAQSSLARLQSTEKGPRPDMTKGKPELMHSPSGDSDKENWIPHEGGNARRRPLPSGRADMLSTKTILGDNFNVSHQSTHIGGGMNRKRKVVNTTPKIFEDQENSGGLGDEVEKFMRGEVSPSKRGEFEGAQALLAMMGSLR